MIHKIIASLLCLFLVGGAAWAQDANPTPVDAGGDPVYQGLSVSNVYVDPQVHGIDTQKLMQATMQGLDSPHTRVKIAILADLPVQVGSPNHYASGLYRNLGLDKDALVLVVIGGGRRGVEVVSQALSQEEETRLAREYASAVNTNPTDGTAALAQAVASDINGREYRSSAGLWVVFLIVVVVIGGQIGRAHV